MKRTIFKEIIILTSDSILFLRILLTKDYPFETFQNHRKSDGKHITLHNCIKAVCKVSFKETPKG